MILSPEFDLHEGEMLLVRKPKGWTSFDVVNKIRGLFHIAKVGHAGTLDPMATGLLIICTGKKTKEIDQYAGLEKEYNATMILGARTSSFDAETPVIERRSIDDVTEETVRAALASFAGYQTQLAPMWSAAKVDGKRLYKYARNGVEVQRRPREVNVYSIVPTRIMVPEVQFTVVCSKGTYIRALVDDIGKLIGCGAYLTALERTRIDQFCLTDAVTIDDLIDYRRNRQDRIESHENRSIPR
jgi:tRNA pseudouridine55 synthase